jgi:hypothetical protein
MNKTNEVCSMLQKFVTTLTEKFYSLLAFVMTCCQCYQRTVQWNVHTYFTFLTLVIQIYLWIAYLLSYSQNGIGVFKIWHEVLHLTCIYNKDTKLRKKKNFYEYWEGKFWYRMPKNIRHYYIHNYIKRGAHGSIVVKVYAISWTVADSRPDEMNECFQFT